MDVRAIRLLRSWKSESKDVPKTQQKQVCITMAQCRAECQKFLTVNRKTSEVIVVLPRLPIVCVIESHTSGTGEDGRHKERLRETRLLSSRWPVVVVAAAHCRRQNPIGNRSGRNI